MSNLEPWKIEVLREWLAAGTPGPWGCDETGVYRIMGDVVAITSTNINREEAEANAKKITAAVNVLPEALDEIERLRGLLADANKKNERLRSELKAAVSEIHETE